MEQHVIPKGMLTHQIPREPNHDCGILQVIEEAVRLVPKSEVHVSYYAQFLNVFNFVYTENLK